MRASPNAMRVGALVLVAAAAVAALYVTPATPTTPVETPIAPPAARDAEVVDTARDGGRRGDPRPNLLLFTIDTLRADHVSAYGYDRDTTPTLTALARRGTRFDRAYAAATWTVPSIASIVTGVLPSQHGVTHGFRIGFRADAESIVGQEILSDELPTIATRLHDSGYRTVAVVANVHLSQLLGFGRGFDSYECLDFFSTSDDVRPVVAAQLDALRQSETPYFLWVHLVDPHASYHPRGAVFDEWWPPPRTRYPELDDYFLEELLLPHMLGEGIPLTDGLAYAMTAYDSEIRAADDYLAELLAALDDGHLAVMVTADHGEEFQDHLRVGHGHTAFDEVARVPLVITIPGREAHVDASVVSLLDVMPTMLELAGAPPASGAPGRSLLPATLGQPLEPREAVIETGRGDEIVRALVAGSLKYGRMVAPDPLEGLFDLEADPRELHSLVEERPEVARAMRERLDRIVLDAAAQRPLVTTLPMEVSDAVRDQLRALGYGN